MRHSAVVCVCVFVHVLMKGYELSFVPGLVLLQSFMSK